MKTFKRLCLVGVCFIFAHSARGSAYLGTWQNNTFGSHGALIIDLALNPTEVTGLIDFDGAAFGTIDPPAIPFHASFANGGIGRFSIAQTEIGIINGSIDTKGNISLLITNVPDRTITQISLAGKFDLKHKKFRANYQMFNTGGLFETGTAIAHVPSAPVVRMAKRVDVVNRTAEVQARVVSNTPIRSIKATTTGSAIISITGTNPYVFRLRKISDPRTNVRIVVVNADGLRTRQFVSFIRRPLSP
jgi:hypothetical protein